MNRSVVSLMAILYLFILVGNCSCVATILNGSKQKVSFISNPSGAQVYINGQNTGKITPCEINVKRKVKPSDTHRRNEQHYVLKKEGYYDFEVKDRRQFSLEGLVSIALPTIIFSAAIIPFDKDLTRETFYDKAAKISFYSSFLTLFPLDFITGAVYEYDKYVDVTLVKKAPELVYLDSDSTQIDPFKLDKVYAVIIGVSEYNVKNMNLKYADDDAGSFYEFLKSPQGGSVPDENITLLLNKDATRANIIKAINSQFKKAFEEDIIIVYMACHGVPSPDNDELFFLGTDTDMDNLEGTGVSQFDIQRTLNISKATKKIWITDACHSGIVGTDGKNKRSDQDKAQSSMVNRLLSTIPVNNKNIILLTASAAGETSQESPRWGGGHGVFTYYMVEGLKGEADENKNGLVDIRELYEYVREKVSIDTNKKQFPELKGVYSDKFPMSIVNPK